MNIREMMNNNPAMVTIGAVVVLVLCLGAIMCQLKGPNRPTGPIDLYFFDESSGVLFTAASDQHPPIAAPSDAGSEMTSGVRAHVFGCGDCPGKFTGMTAAEIEAKGGFIGFFEKYTPEAKAAMERSRDAEDPGMEMMYEMDAGRLIRMPDSDQWFDANSERGVDVYSEIRTNCPSDKRPKQCFPNR